jgi:ElaB/YqjD/DUF883 family membrane-anchored ribosome-binding protein
MGENADDILRRLAQTRNEIDKTVETIVDTTLGETVETVKQTLDVTRERVAASVASTAAYLPDRGTLVENAQHLAENAQALAESLGTKGQQLAENAQALAGTLGSNAQHLAGNAQTIAETVGTNAQTLAGTVGTNAKRAYSLVRENPLGLVIGGLAVGFLAGLVAPITDVEREKIGPIRDDLLRKGTTAAQTAVAQGLGSL